MPEIPAEAIEAAGLAIRHEDSGTPETMARAALEAAAPLLAEILLTPLAKRHTMIPSEWGGGHCATCWTRGGSRAAWPCSEMLAIAALLPATPADPLGQQPVTGED